MFRSFATCEVENGSRILVALHDFFVTLEDGFFAKVFAFRWHDGKAHFILHSPFCSQRFRSGFVSDNNRGDSVTTGVFAKGVGQQLTI